MKGNMEERACQLALYIIENKATVRAAARKFNISKSTVHKDLSERLPAFNRTLYLQAKQVLEENKAQRHIRGGMATRRKYKGIGPDGRRETMALFPAAGSCIIRSAEHAANATEDTAERRAVQ